MNRFKRLALALSALVISGWSAVVVRAVENTWDYSVQVSSTVQTSPARITLQWPQPTSGTPASYTVYRKAPGATSWGSGTGLAGTATSYVDTNVTAGTPYEYRLVMAAGGYTGYGYIQTAINAPLVDQRGKVVLIVDQTFSTPLATELTRLEWDLAGDGWTVIRHDVSRTASPTSVKNLIRTAYNDDPANVKSVFLFGHVPVPYSGQINPDGHPDHIGAWPADVYYGDMDGSWTDSTVNYVQTQNRDPADGVRLSNRPGDGKFDPSTIPSPVELEVGRVDLANMPGDDYWGIDAVIPSELELLRRYLNKDHNFRHRVTNPARRALVGDYLGVLGGNAPAASAFRSFAPLVGADAIKNISRETNGQPGVWIPEASRNDYLLAGGFSYASYGAIHDLGSAGPAFAAPIHEFVARDVRGVITLLFGSWHGDWDHADNVLRAPLLTNHGLLSVWSGRPHWNFHPMGLGETAGYVTRLTQNNTGLYETQQNPSRNMIHIALMGDPTLRLHPVVPARALTGSVSGTSVTLAWQAANDSAIAGYHVYRGGSRTGPFTRLTSAPVTTLAYTDSAGSSSAIYMVRAIKQENTTSGSYYNPSQGIFWSEAGGTSGGVSPPTPPATVDTAAPAISLTSPAAGTTVSGLATLAASAMDNIAVAGVQFRIDGANAGAEDTTAPYSVTVDTTTLGNGTHLVTAVARDTSGNVATSAGVTITVSNGGTAPPPAAGTDTVWFDDALPAGASGAASTGGDSWNWISSNPAPFSGTKAHQTNLAAGLHEHAFGWGEGLAIAAGDRLFAYVYLDPANMPAEIMLSWRSDTWEHRAYWGADRIGYGSAGTASRYHAGALPVPGQWVRLEVPASAVGLEGHTATMMGFSLYGGRATWDKSGKTGGTTTTPPPAVEPPPTVEPPPVVVPPPIVTPPPTTGTTSETLWFDDALPAGAGGSGTGGDGWNWVSASPTPFSGTRAHQSNLAAGLHEHLFGWGATMSLAAGDTIFTYVWLDPVNPPSEIMLSWKSDTWEHRAYWGADRIAYGAAGSVGRFYAGALPPAGQWVRLEVPARAVGLEGHTVTMMGFSQFDGRATWDKTGKAAPTSGTTPPPPPPAIEPPPTPPPSSTRPEFAWIDDALPAGASGVGHGESWNWISSGPTPFSGTRAHPSAAAAGLHEHYFAWGDTMTVGAGENLYVYVYIDPASPTSAIMLSWHDGTWEHRAYWGADKIDYGTRGTPGRYYAGALPAAGQWVRLDVPASAVDLEGRTVSAMCFSTFDGRVVYDKAGKQ